MTEEQQDEYFGNLIDQINEAFPCEHIAILTAKNNEEESTVRVGIHGNISEEITHKFIKVVSRQLND